MNGDCIQRTQICDGNFDCRDGSDESGCSKQNHCEPNEFKCANRKCVLKTWLCDGQNDCEDNSDEENCSPNSENPDCLAHEYQCGNGQCIPKTFQCDTHLDCQDGTDEVGCSKPTVAVKPPPMVRLPLNATFVVSCRAVGVPVPLISWRLNWGHIPEKCTTTSVHGIGVLTCPNVEVRDSGAYSCEVTNSMGWEVVAPDTILTVTDDQSVCQRGQFNRNARRPEECINCFCFGVSTQCSSADLYTYAVRTVTPVRSTPPMRNVSLVPQLPPPVTSLTVVGVVGPFNGERDLRITDYKQNDLIATHRGVQLRMFNVQVGQEYPYYAMPADFHGNQLMSYGGFFRYDVEFNAGGTPINAPDIILIVSASKPR